MNKELASIFKNKLVANGGLQFVEVIAGLAEVVTTNTPSHDGTATVQQKFPVSADTTIAQGCAVSPERILTPNSKLRGLLYFEDYGTTYIGMRNRRHQFRSSLILVCWMNKAKFSDDVYKHITSTAVAEIMRKLEFNTPRNEANFISLTPKMGRVLPQDASIFQRYTYSEPVNQYLRPPFDFFAIQIATDFELNPNCISNFKGEEQVCY